MYNMNRQNEQIYGRNDMVMLDGHNKIYGSLGIAEPYVLQSQEGASIVARGIKEGSFDDVVTEFRMFGRSEQDTTTGAQLIPFELDAEMTSEDGVAKCVPKKDGFHIELNGNSTQTPKSDIRFVGGSNYHEEDSYDEYENLPAGTYYAKISGNNLFILYVTAWRGTNITLISTSTGGSFEVQDGDKFRIFIRPYASAVDATVKAIISKQNDSVMYEPYTGGKPSPSTNYPQEITSAGDDGDVQVDVLGKNIFDSNYFADHYEVKGVVSYLGYKVPVGSKWTCSTSKPEKEGPIRDVFFSGRVHFTSVASGVSDQISRTVVADSGMIYLGIRSGDSLTSIVNGNYWVQIEPSKSATDYSPCTSQSLTVQTPNGLPGIPVTSGGNYTDESGQQWICDEVDFRRGKYVQRVKKEYLTGTPNFQKASGSVKHKWLNALTNSYKSGNSAVLSTFGIYSAWANPIEGNEVICIDGQNLYWSTPTEMTAEEANTKFSKMIASDNPPYVIGQLATPIETDLSEEQMQQFLALRPYYPTTVVTSDEDVWMKMSYKALEMGV